MSDSVRPHRWQPTRLPCPWNSPGKNTGVGCHFLLQILKVKRERELTQSCPILSDPKDCGRPGSPSMGFSRQEYWSGVPLPSPSESIVYLKIYSWCGTCSGFAQMCHGSTSIESHMVFTALNILCAPPVHPSSSYSLSTTDLLTVFLVLPFPE